MLWVFSTILALIPTLVAEKAIPDMAPGSSDADIYYLKEFDLIFKLPASKLQH